jgi:putative ABC transport system permease protein
MKYFPLLWAGLWRRKTRTILTLLSVVVAFLLFGVLQGVNTWLSNAVADTRVNRLYTVSKISYVEPLPLAYLTQIESVPGVEVVAHQSWFGGSYQDSKNTVISYPTDVRRFFQAYPELKIPPEQLQAMERTRNGAVIGAQLARQYGWKVGDRVPLLTSIWTKKDGTSSYEFEIVGIYTAPQLISLEQNFLMNWEYFDESRAFGHGQVGWYIFRIRDSSQSTAIAKQVDALFENSMHETKTQNEQEFLQAQLKQLGNISFMVNAIVGAVMFTLLFLTGNTMMQSVRERIPELAVLKTLGFTDGVVTALVLAESALLCLIAALVGLGLAAAIFPVAGSFIGATLLMPMGAVVAGIVAALLLALVSGGPPAWRASRLAVVDALAGR